jgi:hypothetical protein
VVTIELIAHVECRSETTGEEKPVAIRIGGRQLAIDEVTDDAVVGSPDAGGPCYRRQIVELADGTILRLQRLLPAGRWRVFRL